MSTEIKKEIQLEIAHVLFMDIVGYSKLLINEQRALLDIATLERLLKMPGGSPPLTPALLRLDPEFDSLRGDLRFQQLVTESGPKR